jgi:hypothetical protein
VNEAFRTPHQHRQHDQHCEVGSARSQSLPAGDYMWVARRGDEERVLDCLVERKTKFDLGRCIVNPSKTYGPLTTRLSLWKTTPTPTPAICIDKTRKLICLQAILKHYYIEELSSSIYESIDFLIRQHRRMLSGRPRFAREISSTCSKIDNLVDRALKNPDMQYYWN